MNKIFFYIFIAFILMSISSAFTYYYIVKNINASSNDNNKNTAICTLEAKVCPDGSIVGRVGPKCEFERCPNE
jgi:hypothetical protein